MDESDARADVGAGIDPETVRSTPTRAGSEPPASGSPGVDVRGTPAGTPAPGRGEPGRQDPGRQDPGRQDPGRQDPGRQDPGRQDPGRQDPGRQDPGRQGRPETTRRVDTESSALGDVRRPPAPAPVWTELDGSEVGQHPGAVDVATPGRSGPASTGTPVADLSSAQLLRPQRRPPQTGWRRAVHLLSRGAVNPGESQADTARRELISRVNQPLHGCYKIAMLSLKGGVGKTTMTATLGSTFASLRGDRVVAVDANPDRGTLAQKIPPETTATVRHLLRDAPHIRRYSDVRAYTSQGPSRLEILASEQDPAVSEAFSEVDYRRTVDLLELFYNVVLTDCGTGLMHSAMKGVLDVADSLLVVSSASIDGARSASATLDWLDAHGYRDLVARSTAVINCVRRSSGGVDLDRVSDHFAARCRAVVRVPFDAHLDDGGEIALEELAGGTRAALLELAATVADDFPRAGARRGLPSAGR